MPEPAARKPWFRYRLALTRYPLTPISWEGWVVIAGLLLSIGCPRWLSQWLDWDVPFAFTAGWFLLVGLLFVTIIVTKSDFES